jgi:hypothetical protein
MVGIDIETAMTILAAAETLRPWQLCAERKLAWQSSHTSCSTQQLLIIFAAPFR